MRNRFSTSITALLLSALMLGGVLFMPATALAKRSQAPNVNLFMGEQKTGQFFAGRDSNSFQNTAAHFMPTYEMDKGFEDTLLKMAARSSQKEYGEVLAQIQREWGGSCYGISGTMVLNYLTKYRKAFRSGDGIDASIMQPYAVDYKDIGIPKNNRLALSYINFYQNTWGLKSSHKNARQVSWLVHYTSNRMRYYNLDAVAQKAMQLVDNSMPFQLIYYYDNVSNGETKNSGHAVVGVDYFDAGKYLYIKCYDENDRTYNLKYRNDPRLAVPHFSYLVLRVIRRDAAGKIVSVAAPYRDKRGNEYICFYDYNYSYNPEEGDLLRYTSKHIDYLAVQDVYQVYYNLKNAMKNAGAGDAGILSAASSDLAHPILTLYDTDSYGENYRIKPFVYAEDAPDGVAYADSCGRLYKIKSSGGLEPYLPDDIIPDLPEPIDPDSYGSIALAMPDPGVVPDIELPDVVEYPPIPVDADDVELPFGNMAKFDADDAGEPGYRYECYDEEEGELDMEIDLLQAGKVKGLHKVYDGYDIALPNDKTLGGVSLEYGGSFASVSGAGIELVRFSSDGRLRDVNAANGGGSMELYFGTENEVTGLDMFRMGLEDFGFLQVYDKQDSGEFANSVVLRTDGLANGFDFTFYQEELVSDDYEGYSTDGSEQDTWIKIESFKNPQTGELGVKVWTEEEDGNASTLPTFSEPPIFTEEMHERPSMPNYPSGGGSDSSSDYIPAARQTVHSNDGSVSLSSVAISAGDALIAQPLTSGADYNFMLEFAGNNEVVKMYDIHLASGQSSLGGGAELCFALGARYANEGFTLVHKKADGSVEYFYASADGSGNVCFTGIYSLSPFMLVKGRLSATAVTTPIAEVPATGGAALGAYAALLGALLLAAFTFLRSKRKYTNQ